VRTASTAVLRHGRELFISSCASCHGMQAQGKPGTAPSLRGVGEMAANFYLKTGRMPLNYPRQQPTEERPAFDSVDINALVSYIGTFGGPSIPKVDPSKGSVVRGQEAFALNCAGCHTIQGQGGMVTGSSVPSLNRATPTQIGEALRIGPYLMPRFGIREISEYEVDSIAAYVRTIQHPEDRGGWGIGRIGPIPEGMVTWLLAITAILLIARLLGERTPPRRRAG
jgi:ubiquinol-cytochrome c reductase cytochrome c subunit